MAIAMANAKPVLVSTDKNYQLDIDLIKKSITTKTRAIVTVSPNNPSGAVYSESLLKEINQLCAKYGIYHINDEAYEYFIFDNNTRIISNADPRKKFFKKNFVIEV